MITEAHIDELLEHWATECWYAAALAEAWSENQTGGLAGSIVHRTREQGVRTKLQITGRAKIARRLIAKALRAHGAKLHIPAWAGGDPIRCKASQGGAPRWTMPPVAEQVDRWVTELWHWDPRAAMALRAHYRDGKRTNAGARWVAQVTQMRVTSHGYIAAIARGRLAIRRAAELEMKKRA